MFIFLMFICILLPVFFFFYCSYLLKQNASIPSIILSFKDSYTQTLLLHKFSRFRILLWLIVSLLSSIMIYLVHLFPFIYSIYPNTIFLDAEVISTPAVGIVSVFTLNFPLAIVSSEWLFTHKLSRSEKNIFYSKSTQDENLLTRPMSMLVLTFRDAIMKWICYILLILGLGINFFYWTDYTLYTETFISCRPHPFAQRITYLYSDVVAATKRNNSEGANIYIELCDGRSLSLRYANDNQIEEILSLAKISLK